jgi:hypothetical protein
MEVAMAPYDVTSWGSLSEPGIHVLLGMGFGFVLERAGFGSAKKLTNQFYLNDMTVLKVMFTAIITAMVLILVATGFGLLDYDRLWVNPTYLGSGVVGGLLFGVGFVVGGYCPGTALVGAATLKLDGLLFIVGVLGGIFGFGYTEPMIDGFWNDSGNYGRLTLMDWLGLPMPLSVLLAVTLALLFFAGGEWVERLVQRPPNASTTPVRRFRAAYGYAAVLLTTATLMILAWNPTRRLRSAAAVARIEASIQARRVQIDPRELADLMRDKRLALTLVDLRDEASFNRFHLLDAKRVDHDFEPHGKLPPRSVKILLANDEPTELAAYRRLAGRNVENLYVLAGGLPAWSELFDARGCDQRQAALGANHPFSRPPLLGGSESNAYVARVKRPGIGAKKAGGGCGG